MNYFNYYTEIEDTFVRRRGKHLMLSPLDWAMIESWKERGIPLHIVIRAIEAVFDVFDRQPAGTRTIKSLFFCKEEVEVQFAEWTASQTGKGESTEDAEQEFTTEAISAHIDRVIEQLGRVDNVRLAEDLARAVERLTEIRAGLTKDLESIDGKLGDIERLLERAMLQNWEPEHLKAIDREVRDQLKAYRSQMEPEKYKQMLGLMVLKRLREEAGIPRLGLYYL